MKKPHKPHNHTKDAVVPPTISVRYCQEDEGGRVSPLATAARTQVPTHPASLRWGALFHSPSPAIMLIDSLWLEVCSHLFDFLEIYLLACPFCLNLVFVHTLLSTNFMFFFSFFCPDLPESQKFGGTSWPRRFRIPRKFCLFFDRSSLLYTIP